MSLEEVKEGTEKNYSFRHKLTPEALAQLQSGIGKQVVVEFSSERWVYEGPDDDEDYSFSEGDLCGKLVKVDETAIEIETETRVVVDKTLGERGSFIRFKNIKLPFYEGYFALRHSAEISQIEAITIEDRKYLPATL